MHPLQLLRALTVVGSEVVLQTLPVSGQLGSMGAMGRGMMGPGQGMMGSGMGSNRGRRRGGMGHPDGPIETSSDVLPLVRFRIEREEKSGQKLPEKLSAFERGRTFRMTDVARDERVRRGTIEIWQFENQSGGGMGMGGMALPHPMHIHDIQFQVLEREMLDPAMRPFWEELRAGFIDEGWKDTVLVMPGERVTLITRFGDYEGLYLYHCHNLEHEDMGMMRNFLVEA